MIHENIELCKVFTGLGKDGKNPILTSYIIENSPEIKEDYKRPCVIICPGGGYEFTSDREAEPVALKFIAQGINACVLRYSVAPYHYPSQLLELAGAIAYIRGMKEDWQVDTDKIIVCGFSAGAHLAGSLGTLWQEAFISDELGIEEEKVKPNAVILSYPVITGGEMAHKGSFDNLLGKEASDEERSKLSLEKRVTKNMPPTFIWHTLDDNAVPVENTFLFAKALKENEISFEMHIYPKGVHGLSLADKTTANHLRPEQVNSHVATWFNLAIDWMKLVLK